MVPSVDTCHANLRLPRRAVFRSCTKPALAVAGQQLRFKVHIARNPTRRLAVAHLLKRLVQCIQLDDVGFLVLNGGLLCSVHFTTRMHVKTKTRARFIMCKAHFTIPTLRRRCW